MMAGAIGFWPGHLSFYELRQVAAGAKPETYHEPTRKALLKQQQQRGGKQKTSNSISLDEDPQGFWSGLKSAFVKGGETQHDKS